MPGSLEGTVALVTGASSGIGEATALALAGQGAAVAIAARRTDRLEQLAEQIRDDGGTALALGADVSDSEQADAAGDGPPRSCRHGQRQLGCGSHGPPR